MLLWSLSIFCFFLAVLTPGLRLFERFLFLISQSEEKFLRALENELTDLQLQLETGILPPEQTWKRLREYRAPWGPLCADSLTEIRRSGGALIPTLKRLLALVRSHLELLRNARAKSAQALAQAGTGFVLIPSVGLLLYHLLPGMEGRALSWAVAMVAALFGVSLGGFWVLALAENARWGGLSRDRRAWPLECMIAGERMISLLKTGNPPDIAWSRACEDSILREPRLREVFSSSVWSPDARGEASASPVSLFYDWAQSIRAGVKASVIEGRPCQDRVEHLLASFRSSWRDQVERELGLVATRALKPLFICVAPSVLFLFAVAFFWAWESAMEGGF
jgi:hypothetical protein